MHSTDRKTIHTHVLVSFNVLKIYGWHIQFSKAIVMSHTYCVSMNFPHIYEYKSYGGKTKFINKSSRFFFYFSCTMENMSLRINFKWKWKKKVKKKNRFHLSYSNAAHSTISSTISHTHTPTIHKCENLEHNNMRPFYIWTMEEIHTFQLYKMTRYAYMVPGKGYT